MGTKPYRVPLHNRGKLTGYVLLDHADLTNVIGYHWHLHRGYAARTGKAKGERIFLHRELLGLEAGDSREVDHLNRNRLDNRRTNMRILPGKGPNTHNLPAYREKFGHRGVDWFPRASKWRVRVAGRYVGLFLTEEEAITAATEARAKILPYALD